MCQFLEIESIAKKVHQLPRDVWSTAHTDGSFMCVSAGNLHNQFGHLENIFEICGI